MFSCFGLVGFISNLVTLGEMRGYIMYKGMVGRTVLVIVSDLDLKNEYANSEVVLEGSADELEEKEVFLSREIQSTPCTVDVLEYFCL